jgi:hypothetical protein
MDNWHTIMPPCEVGLLLMLAEYESQLIREWCTPDSVDDAIVFCQTCRHGGHAAHILEWFYGEAGAKSRGTCAVADCDHRCAEEF